MAKLRDPMMSGLLRLRTKAGSRNPCICTLIRKMSSRIFVLPIDPTSKPGSSSLLSIDPVQLWSSAPTGSKAAKVGTTRLFYDTPASQPGKTDTTAVVSLGEGFDKKTDNARRELVRKAIGSSIKQIRELGDGKKSVVVDASRDAHAAGLPQSRFVQFLYLLHRSCSHASCQVQIHFKDISTFSV